VRPTIRAEGSGWEEAPSHGRGSCPASWNGFPTRLFSFCVATRERWWPLGVEASGFREALLSDFAMVWL
jgi:hypothetical protein